MLKLIIFAKLNYKAQFDNANNKFHKNTEINKIQVSNAMEESNVRNFVCMKYALLRLFNINLPPISPFPCGSTQFFILLYN